MKDGVNIINYSNIFLSCFADNAQNCTPMITDHGLVYILGGELEINENGKITRLHKDECVFIRKDNRVSIKKLPTKDEQFKSVWLSFTRNFLREFFHGLDKTKIPENAKRCRNSLQALPANRPDVKSLFQSMTPYFDANAQPTPELVKLKMTEGVYCLLNTDNSFYAALFDFSEPWKIDILDYLNKNYMYELTMEEIASYTGRSLAAFKRDFKKISDLSPQKWLIQKRLEVAHSILRNENKSVTDVCEKVGFKNLSHFSKIYKKTFGHAPTQSNLTESINLK